MFVAAWSVVTCEIECNPIRGNLTEIGHKHHFFIVTELLHVAYQKIATNK